jgi:hypothetical protein
MVCTPPASSREQRGVDRKEWVERREEKGGRRE